MASNLTAGQKKFILNELGVPSAMVKDMSEQEMDDVVDNIPDKERQEFIARALATAKSVINPPTTQQPTEEVHVSSKSKAVEHDLKPAKKKEETEVEKYKKPIEKEQARKDKETERQTESAPILKQKDLKLIVIEPEVNLKQYTPAKTDRDMADYVERPEYIKTMSDFYDLKSSLLLMGEAGSGKSTIAKYFALKKGLPFFSVSADSMMNIRELFGSLHIQGATSFFVEGLFTYFTKIPSVILIDEVTALDPAKNFVFHQILAQRRFYVKDANETYDLHEDCFILFAGNPPNVKYTGLSKFNVAFADRMGTLIIDPLTQKQYRVILNKMPQADFETLMRYHYECQSMIKQANLRAEFSLRSLRRIAGLLALGYSWRKSIDLGFLNGIQPFDKKAYDSLLVLTQSTFKD